MAQRQTKYAQKTYRSRRRVKPRRTSNVKSAGPLLDSALLIEVIRLAQLALLDWLVHLARGH